MVFPSAYTTEAAAGCCIQFDVPQQNMGFDKLKGLQCGDIRTSRRLGHRGVEKKWRELDFRNWRGEGCSGILIAFSHLLPKGFLETSEPGFPLKSTGEGPEAMEKGKNPCHKSGAGLVW